MGTAERLTIVRGRYEGCCYSLSRDGDSGTPRDGLDVADGRVSIRCREMGTAEHVERHRVGSRHPGFYSLSRDGDSGTRGLDHRRASRGKFLFAVARWGQRNPWASATAEVVTAVFLFAVARWGQRNTEAIGDRFCTSVSIRCREMGTAEPNEGHLFADGATTFLFAVARWGQRNTVNDNRFSFEISSFYSLSRDGDSGTIVDSKW